LFAPGCGAQAYTAARQLLQFVLLTGVEMISCRMAGLPQFLLVIATILAGDHPCTSRFSYELRFKLNQLRRKISQMHGRLHP